MEAEESKKSTHVRFRRFVFLLMRCLSQHGGNVKAGARGVLITCEKDLEKRAAREVFNLLNQVKLKFHFISLPNDISSSQKTSFPKGSLQVTPNP